MNETIDTILKRRSVRVYSEEQVNQADLDTIIKAGLYAPSACNMQPWHFTVIQNKELIETLGLESKKEFLNSENELFRKMAENEKYNIFYHAPTIIVISGEKKAEMPQVDCALATQNISIAAESLGLGTCIIGLIAFLFQSARVDKFIEKLEIPEGYEPYYAITIGHKKLPDLKPAPRRENTVSYIK